MLVLPIGLGGCVPRLSTGTAGVSDAQLEADRAILAGLLPRVLGLQVQVRRARAGSSARARRLAPLARLHAAQLAALGGRPARGVEPAVPPGRDLGAVRDAEQAWITMLTSAAVAAAEPRLALLLGAMAAGVGQELTRLAGGRVEADAGRDAEAGTGAPSASPSASAALSTGTRDALQAALGAEHAALYVVQTLGARTPFDSDLRDRFLDLVARHTARRDRLIADLVAAGVAPVGPQAAYAVPDGTTGTALAAAAGDTEQALLPAYAGLTAATIGEQRAWALVAWREIAEEAVRWGRTPQRLPGLP